MIRQRLGRPIVPKEHGAWAILYGGFLAGVGLAGRVTLPVVLLLGGVSLLALANGPATSLLRPAGGQAASLRERRALGWLVLYGIGAALCLAPLFTIYRMTFLLPFGMAGALGITLRGFLVREGRDRSLPSELVGTAGLALVGPAAHAVAAGTIQPAAAVLWLLLFLFFASGVFYVRMRVRAALGQRRGAAEASDPARRFCLLYHLLLLFLIPGLAVSRLLPWPALLAFAPALWRAAAGMRRREAILSLRRLGWSEVGLTAAFVLLLVLFV